MNTCFTRRVAIGLVFLSGSIAALWRTLKGGRRSSAPSILYMSDVHLSLPQGRYSHLTPIFEQFLESWSKGKRSDEWLLYLNGDYVDRVFSKEDKIRSGDENYQVAETKLFLDTARPSFKKVLVNFGTGHDFGNLEKAEEQTGSNRIGSYKWGKVDLVWFTVLPATFGTRPALLEEEYGLLEKLLSQSENAIVMTHVPLRTKESYEHGKWSNGENLTIPETDRIFSILKRQSSQILAIFQGHVHVRYASELFGIPVYCFPFIKDSSHCELKQDDQYVCIYFPDDKNACRRLKIIESDHGA